MTTYSVTFIPESDPRRAPKPPVTRKAEIVHAFSTGAPLRHYVRFAPARGYYFTVEVSKIVRIEVA